MFNLFGLVFVKFRKLKSSTETEKGNGEIMPIKENKGNKITNTKTPKTVEKKFQQKIEIKNATEIFQKFPTKEDLNSGYLKEHFRNFEILASEMNKTEIYIILTPSNIHCFNRIMKDWPEVIIKKDQLKVYEKYIKPTLCVNKIPKNIEAHTVKSI